ncbi:hypothetical protein MMC12_004481 [Toensbergia leucococca]|nr:hypothetical protein [Toensbergia leucococca]
MFHSSKIRTVTEKMFNKQSTPLVKSQTWNCHDERIILENPHQQTVPGDRRHKWHQALIGKRSKTLPNSHQPEPESWNRASSHRVNDTGEQLSSKPLVPVPIHTAYPQEHNPTNTDQNGARLEERIAWEDDTIVEESTSVMPRVVASSPENVTDMTFRSIPIIVSSKQEQMREGLPISTTPGAIDKQEHATQVKAMITPLNTTVEQDSLADEIPIALPLVAILSDNVVRGKEVSNSAPPNAMSINQNESVKEAPISIPPSTVLQHEEVPIPTTNRSVERGQERGIRDHDFLETILVSESRTKSLELESRREKWCQFRAELYTDSDEEGEPSTLARSPAYVTSPLPSPQWKHAINNFFPTVLAGLDRKSIDELVLGWQKSYRVLYSQKPKSIPPLYSETNPENTARGGEM